MGLSGLTHVFTPLAEVAIVNGACGSARRKPFEEKGLRQMSSRGSIARVVARVASAVLLSLALVAASTASALAAQAPKVEEQWTAEVSASSASLRATVNPEEAATTYRFEYATSEAALLAGEGEVFPAPPTPEGSAGAGSEGVVVEAHPQDLQPHTSYWYRVLATNAEGKTPGCEAPARCESFTTQPTPEGSELLDGRTWELVSPAIKDDGFITTIKNGGGLIQAAEDGNAFTYLATGPINSEREEPAGNAHETQLLSLRSAGGGWSTQDIATPHEVSAGESVGHGGQEYKWFSPDLSVGLVQPFGSGPYGERAEGAVPLSEGASEKTSYVRANVPLLPGPAEQVSYHEAVVEGVYKPLVTSKPGYADVPEGTIFGGAIEFLGASSDLSHAIIASRVPLREHGESGELYEWTAGKEPREQLQPVSVLPSGAQAGEATLGSPGEDNETDARGAVAANGSRISWSYHGHLFMRYLSSDNTMHTLQLDGKGTGEGRAFFQFATDDGSKVFFTDDERLTANSTAESEKRDLYECAIVEKEEGGKEVLSCELSDLTAGGGEAADVQGPVAVGSNESTDIYLVATGTLGAAGDKNAQGQEAEPGKDNLYALHYDKGTMKWEPPVFIAVLSGEDLPDWANKLSVMTSRVSPDGKDLAFMSDRSLTGYNNADVNSSEPDEEVYLYSAPTTGEPSGRLVCVSCNPTGERPAGVLDSTQANRGQGLLADRQRIWSPHGGRWLAGSIPGWTATSEGLARYQSRYLSDSGRVFFDSSDALVPQATNGLEDVYEYEPAGVGTCEDSSASFSKSSGGCIALISSGAAGEESTFLDASESGEDVFFLTSAQLVRGDRDTAFDVYDAHVCSATIPCSTEVVTPPACATVDACRAAPAPQPQVFGAPSSATFAGSGDLPPPPAAVTVKPKAKSVTCKRGFVKKHGRCVRRKANKAKGRASKARRRGNDGRARS